MWTMSRSKLAGPQQRGDGYHHGDLRRALIQAGRQILAEGGVESLSLREVARRAKVSHAAPYHHFDDKADLIAAIVLSGLEDFSHSLRVDPSPDSNALQRMTEMGLAYVRFAIANPQLFRLLMRPELWGEASRGPASQAMEKAMSATYEMLRETVKAAVDEGSVRGSADDVSIAALSAVHGLSTLLLDGPVDLSGRSPEKLARAVIRSLGTGIMGRSATTEAATSTSVQGDGKRTTDLATSSQHRSEH